MSATPHLTAGLPDGTEPIGAIQSLARDYTDTAGRLVESDRYFSLAGVTYATTKFPGTAGTNYDATVYGYDDRGRLDRVLNPVGTITDVIYDSLGRRVSALRRHRRQHHQRRGIRPRQRRPDIEHGPRRSGPVRRQRRG